MERRLWTDGPHDPIIIQIPDGLLLVVHTGNYSGKHERGLAARPPARLDDYQYFIPPHRYDRVAILRRAQVPGARVTKIAGRCVAWSCITEEEYVIVASTPQEGITDHFILEMQPQPGQLAARQRWEVTSDGQMIQIN